MKTTLRLPLQKRLRALIGPTRPQALGERRGATMLSREDNDILIHTGPGTLMGNLLRRYWLPACLTSEIPTPDSTPISVRILSEDLVGFRDTQGRVGLIDENCP